jgi:hypothetical protein
MMKLEGDYINLKGGFRRILGVILSVILEQF